MFMIKFLTAFILASCWSLILSIVFFHILWAIIWLFRLNENRDAYWIFSASFFFCLITWVIGFAYIMSASEHKEQNNIQKTVKSFE